MIAGRRKFQEWQTRYDSQAPKIGDLAPDFELRDVQGANPVRLSDFRGLKPVALVFGSFT
jgi:peroxiredoxin